MSTAVLADSQFSIARAYRPFSGFESVYQDQPVSVPLAVPGTKDPKAGSAGYSDNLLAGIAVPYGSRLTLWLPLILSVPFETPVNAGYRYRFVWRMRNFSDFDNREVKPPYHLPSSTRGQSGQVIVPSAINAALYENVPVDEVVPGSPGGTQKLVVQHMQMEAIRSDAQVLAAAAPLLSDGNPAAYQQGLAGPLADSDLNDTITYSVFQCDCLGDELIILIDRLYDSESEQNTWDFATDGRDCGLSRFFGVANTGIYLLGGSNP